MVSDNFWEPKAPKDGAQWNLQAAGILNSKHFKIRTKRLVPIWQSLFNYLPIADTSW